MKTLLGCLMCSVLTMSQSFAISGGPFGGGKGRASVFGAYAGVMQDVMVGSNNFGIFTLSVPHTGLATGSVFIFTGERTFSGPISGLADPNTDSFVGTLQGIPVVSSGTATIETLNFHADGTIKAQVKANKKSFTVSSVRLRGTAHVTTTDTRGAGNCSDDTSTCGTPGNLPCCTTFTDYTVHGFKQSNSSS
jgi:hypothetical protein